MINREYRRLDLVVPDLKRLIVDWGTPVDTGHWQAMKDVPMTKTIELMHVNLEMPIVNDCDEIGANLPWAEKHFQERVGGKPLNPPPSAAEWPFAQRGHKDHTDEQKKFSHTYPERFWPKLAGDQPPLNWGIRYPYGDLNDLLDLLWKEPHTRQAYLPIFFPEDTGAKEGQRIPCTLGYHFLYRDRKLHCSYGIRSCDLLRHFADDVYMAMRLVQWIADIMRFRAGRYQEQTMNTHPWDVVETGKLVMTIGSLHVFEGDMPRLKREVG